MRPVLSVLLSFVACESQVCQQHNSTTKPLLNHFSIACVDVNTQSHCHCFIQPSGHVMILCGHSGFTSELCVVLKFKRLHKLKFSNWEYISSCG